MPESEVPVDAVEGFEVKEPTVCAVMLTRDRPAMAKRAVECWMAQTYENKRLLIIASGESNVYCPAFLLYPNCNIYMQPSLNGWTIGAIRNYANSKTGQDIMIHWDDDDWSHPNRIAEQVALLQSSGADAVGYREMLFWKQIPGNLPHGQAEYECGCGDCRGESWLYTNNDPRYIVGSSLCYWRAAWERQPFKDIMRGEDAEFWKGLKSEGVTSLPYEFGGNPMPGSERWIKNPCRLEEAHQQIPRMICSIHGGNTCGYTEATLTGSINWRRVSEWDSKFREVMSL